MSQIIRSNARARTRSSASAPSVDGGDAVAGVAQRLAGEQLDVGLVVDQQDVQTVRGPTRMSVPEFAGRFVLFIPRDPVPLELTPT